jgi:DNA-binding Xre family transcriptional regulator
MGITYIKLRELLIEKDISLKVLEIMSSVNHDTLSNIYKDKYISLSSLEKIARCLSVGIGDIVSLKD